MIDDDDLPEDDCDHDDYEADILTGIATCGRCGHRWMQTNKDREREHAAQEAYDRRCKEWDAEAERDPLPREITNEDLPF